MEKWLSGIVDPWDIYCVRTGDYSVFDRKEEFVEVVQGDYGQDATPPRGSRRHVVIVSYHLVRNCHLQLTQIPWRFAIADEAHQVLCPKLQQRKYSQDWQLRQAQRNNKSQTYAKHRHDGDSALLEHTVDLLDSIPSKLFLSGTPLGSSSHATSLYHIASLLLGDRYSCFRSHEKFVDRNFDFSGDFCERLAELSWFLRLQLPIIRREKRDAEVIKDLENLPNRSLKVGSGELAEPLVEGSGARIPFSTVVLHLPWRWREGLFK